MPEPLTVEELAIDDSFINYCFHKNEADVRKWQNYINSHPLETGTIEEAKQFVIVLSDMLHEQHFDLEDKPPKPVRNIMAVSNLKRMVVYAAAMLVIIVMLVLQFTTSPDKNKNLVDLRKTNIPVQVKNIYITAKAEKKAYVLPDGTKVNLNAGSELKLSPGFGRTNRTVFLNGEALFNVRHNASLSFIVQTDKCSILDLGTVFNVKAYAGEKTYETSLIKGSIEITLKNNPQKITLVPLQKVTINDTGFNATSPDTHDTTPYQAEIKVLPVLFSTNNSVIETAWTLNRLEIVNERFEDIKPKLERWFNVSIDIKDDKVANYTFTATFEKEQIEDVLKALQYSYHFSYQLKDDHITVSK